MPANHAIRDHDATDLTEHRGVQYSTSTRAGTARTHGGGRYFGGSFGTNGTGLP